MKIDNIVKTRMKHYDYFVLGYRRDNTREERESSMNTNKK